jgi:methanogenic corrinoid protein MtbC1
MIAARDAYFDALRRGDRHAAFQTLDAALDAGADIHAIYLEVVQPSLREIGRLWQDNVISVAEEHLATAITESAMGRVFERVFVWRDGRAPRLLAACADQERHQLGLRMLCDLLEMDGWETIYLGASMPIESLVELVRARRPDVVAISATLATHVSRVREAIRSIRAAQLELQPVIAVGGRAFMSDPSLAPRVGADLTASDAREAVRALNERVPRGPVAV